MSSRRLPGSRDKPFRLFGHADSFISAFIRSSL